VNECADNYGGNLSEYIKSKANELLNQKFASYDQEQVKLTIREVLLSTFDSFWKDHLLSMDHLKEGIGLRSYGQKDPLVEYKRESFTLFEGMKENLKRAVVETIFQARLYTEEEIEEIKKEQQRMLEAQLEAHKRAQAMEEAQGTVRRKQAKVGRNDPCPCGSGKKFKHCHGA
jgi:preprotein translocase subunit SecA